MFSRGIVMTWVDDLDRTEMMVEVVEGLVVAVFSLHSRGKKRTWGPGTRRIEICGAS